MSFKREKNTKKENNFINNNHDNFFWHNFKQSAQDYFMCVTLLINFLMYGCTNPIELFVLGNSSIIFGSNLEVFANRKNYRKTTSMYKKQKRSSTNKGLASWRRRKYRIHICTHIVTKAKFNQMLSWICSTGRHNIVKKTERQFCYNFYEEYWWMQF